MINVLYLDDELHNLTAFRAAFRRDLHVHVTTEPTEAVRILREQPIEVIISDQKMPTLSGVEFF
jgi:CheY-like chemotaxis protein